MGWYNDGVRKKAYVIICRWRYVQWDAPKVGRIAITAKSSASMQAVESGCGTNQVAIEREMEPSMVCKSGLANIETVAKKALPQSESPGTPWLVMGKRRYQAK